MITSVPHTQYNVYILCPAQKILIKLEGGGFHRRAVVCHFLHDLEFPLALLSCQLFFGVAVNAYCYSMFVSCLSVCLSVCLSFCLFVCFSNLDDNEFIQLIYFTIIKCEIYFEILFWYIESSLNGFKWFNINSRLKALLNFE